MEDLQLKINEITDELVEMVTQINLGDYTIDTLKKSAKILVFLKKVKSFSEEFWCSLSKNVMDHPVVISTGETYEQQHIENYFRSGYRTCPKSSSELLYGILWTPNFLLKDIFTSWPLVSQDLSLSVPSKFRCPISNKLMHDPVILCCGHTCDRYYIEERFRDGVRQCPYDQKILSHTVLFSNLAVKSLISKWCAEVGIDYPSPSQDYLRITYSDNELDSLLLKFSSTNHVEQLHIARDLCLISEGEDESSILHLEENLSKIIAPLITAEDLRNCFPSLTESITSILQNLMSRGSKLVGLNQFILPLLVSVARFGSSIVARSTAVVAVFSLADDIDRRNLILELGGVHALANIIKEGHPVGIRNVGDALCAIFFLADDKGAWLGEHKAVLVSAIIQKIAEGLFVTEFVWFLEAFCSTDICDQLIQMEAVNVLLDTIRKSAVPQTVVSAVSIVLTLCMHDIQLLNQVDVNLIQSVSKSGDPKAEEFANQILELLKH